MPSFRRGQRQTDVEQCQQLSHGVFRFFSNIAMGVDDMMRENKKAKKKAKR